MNMLDKAEAMKLRTKQFAIRIVGVVRSLPRTREGDVIGKQLLRCGTAVAANYRAVCRARSHAEFISKISIVVEEADETVFWLELLADTGVVPADKLTLLVKEANELLAICAASLTTAKHNIRSMRVALAFNESMIQSLNDSIPCITTTPIPRWKN